MARSRQTAAQVTSADDDQPMVGQPIDLGHYVPAFVTFIANKWSRSSSALYRRQFGIGIVEWRLIVLLAIEPWITAARCDQVIGMDKAAVSRSVRLLEKRGLIATRQNAVDSRRREMALTAAGCALHDQIAVVALDREARLLSCLKPAEIDTLVALLDRIHQNLPAITQDPRRVRGPKT